VGDFVHTLEDWIDALDEVSAAERAKLSFELTASRRDLESLGWKVLAALVTEAIGHGVDGTWPVSCIAVVRKNRTHVARVDQKFIVVKGRDPEAVV
jgi:hypothetical protein